MGWWIKGKTVPSACPRAIDCPDWRYKGEQPYSRQVKLLKSISKIVDLGKVSIGFETLGIDVQVQMESWEDHALPWTTAPLKDHKPPTPYKNYTYYKPCHQNMTVENYKDNKRCAMPLLSQQWGPKFDADEVWVWRALCGLKLARSWQALVSLPWMASFRRRRARPAASGTLRCKSSTRPTSFPVLAIAAGAPVMTPSSRPLPLSSPMEATKSKLATLAGTSPTSSVTMGTLGKMTSATQRRCALPSRLALPSSTTAVGSAPTAASRQRYLSEERGREVSSCRCPNNS